MCKKCDNGCVYFPFIDANRIEYITDKYGIKHRIHSNLYNCVFLNKTINIHKKCTKYTSVEDMKQYRKEMRII